MTADRTIVVTRYRDDFDIHGKRSRTSWSKFAKWLATHPQGPKRSAGAFIAGPMSGAGRTLAHLEGREAATLDLDANVPGDVDERLAEALPGVAFVRATSSSATQANPKCRVVIPYSRTVTEAEHRNIAGWLLDETGLREFADVRPSVGPVQLMYRCTDTGANLVESTIRDGEFLDVEGVLLLAPDVAASQARDEAGGNALTERMDGQTDERPCACGAERVQRYLSDEVEAGHPAFFDLAGDLWELLHRGHSIGDALTDDGEAVAAYRAHCAAKTRQDDTDRVLSATAARTAGRQDRDMVERHGADDCPDDVLGMFVDEDDFGDPVTTSDTEVPTADTFDRLVAREKQKILARDEARRQIRLEREGEAPGFEVGTVDELAALADEKPAYLVDQVWPIDSAMLLTAQNKTGKTTTLANLARALLTGEPFLGRFETLPVSRVAFLNYEVSAAQIGRWLAEAGVPGDSCLVVNLRGRRNPLGHPEDRVELAGILRRFGAEVLFVDPFANAFTGDNQNDNSEAKTFLKSLDEFTYTEVGARSLVLTNHAGWDGSRTRGASALEDWADTKVLLTKDAHGVRTLSALGRDVDVPEGVLAFDPGTRALTYTEAAGVRAEARGEKLRALEDGIREAVTETPGMSKNELLVALRNAGVRFKNDEVNPARRNLIAMGAIHLATSPTKRGELHMPGAAPGWSGGFEDEGEA